MLMDVDEKTLQHEGAQEVLVEMLKGQGHDKSLTNMSEYLLIT